MTNWFVIGHELASDNETDPGGGLIPQLTIQITDQMRQNFVDAINADERGDSKTRDEKLWSILGYAGPVNPDFVDPARQGNSLQDLRLTVKGYRFGQWVKNNPDLPASDAAKWLCTNVMVNVAYPP